MLLYPNLLPNILTGAQKNNMKLIYSLLQFLFKIEDCGIEILHKESKVLSKEEAAEFYRQHEGSEHFEQLIEFMSR